MDAFHLAQSETVALVAPLSTPFGMVTYGAVADEPGPPARLIAPPSTPEVNAGPRLSVPSKPLPDESFATVPLVSSNLY